MSYERKCKQKRMLDAQVDHGAREGGGIDRYVKLLNVGCLRGNPKVMAKGSYTPSPLGTPGVSDGPTGSLYLPHTILQAIGR
jgi:hypothetical protein